MSSATKTLELLNFFSTTHPEIGLSTLCRLVDWDKATTHRRLKALVQAGLAEQNPISKRYRLGPMILQLAQMRELTVPRKQGTLEPLRQLAEATGETSHVSVLSGDKLFPLSAIESVQHRIRVIMDVQTFPLHATSSGLCALAFGPAELLDIAKKKLTRFTPNTITSADALNESIRNTRASGFGRAAGSFETDVYSLATPVFDQTELFAGTVSCASVATRFTTELEHTVKSQLIKASRQITYNWGGKVPEHIEHTWAQALNES
jgi:DNA-binding IclR family transcriptional regulator